MGLSDFTRQLAQQALPNPVKSVLDALRPGDLAGITDALRTPRPAPPAAGDQLGAVLLGQIQSMQKAVKEDEELVVLFHTGTEVVRVLEFFVPSWSVFVMSGIDTEHNVTRAIAPSESLQLVCKVMKVAGDAKPARVGFIVPKPKQE
ncbi:MAG: hypothetical protein NTY38_18925 [Acidobacteria bacterium]|nr:hypothetical protein [Acidobacteriota bacterium]